MEKLEIVETIYAEDKSIFDFNESFSFPIFCQS